MEAQQTVCIIRQSETTVCLMAHQANPLNDIYCLYRFQKAAMKLLSMFAKGYRALTRRHSLHASEHVGPFAGSLLHLEDWQHS
jgi:hypothetical protein